jgi:hypothetical protein
LRAILVKTQEKYMSKLNLTTQLLAKAKDGTLTDLEVDLHYELCDAERAAAEAISDLTVACVSLLKLKNENQFLLKQIEELVGTEPDIGCNNLMT